MSSDSFKAMVISRTEDGKFTREITTRQIDSLPDGEVLLSVKCSSLNYKDALSAIGNRGVTKNYPHTPALMLPALLNIQKAGSLNLEMR